MHEYIYLYFLNFSFWILIEEIFLSIPLPRRRGYGLRFLIGVGIHCAAGWLLISWFQKVPNEFFWILILYYVLVFCSSIGILYTTFDIGIRECIFIGIAGYAVQHITYALSSCITTFVWLTLGTDPNNNSVYHLFFSYLIYVLSGAAAWLVLVKRHINLEELKRINFRLTLISLAILISSVVLSVVVDNTTERLSAAYVVCRLYSIIACGLGLILQFDVFWRNRMEKEIDVLEQLLHMEQCQHQMTKDTVDIINMKCHDLKYHLKALENIENQAERRESIEELQKAADIYDSVFQTGNDTLDLIMMEKNLLCQKYHINISCIADGAQLDFMAPADIYSLFGNALDNAIESVSQAEQQNRIISIRIERVNDLLQIHIDNYCDKVPEFEDGLPLTTKADKRFHGFGTRSIQHIVNRYGGELRMGGKDHRFNLDIMLFMNQVQNIPQEA